jgi:hypothetical protein
MNDVNEINRLRNKLIENKEFTQYKERKLFSPDKIKKH